MTTKDDLDRAYENSAHIPGGADYPARWTALAGRVVLAKLRAEEARMRAGVSWEPPTFYEKNAAAHAAGVVELRDAAPNPARRVEVTLPAAARVAT